MAHLSALDAAEILQLVGSDSASHDADELRLNAAQIPLVPALLAGPLASLADYYHENSLTHSLLTARKTFKNWLNWQPLQSSHQN